MRTKITSPTRAMYIKKFTNIHVCGEKDAATVSIRKGQFDVIWGKDETPCLFDLREQFCLQSAERKVQLMTIQEFGVCEDSLLLHDVVIDRNFAAGHHERAMEEACFD